jgi:isoleucyl-tRNA synthetase
MEEISRYVPKKIEKKIYEWWETSNILEKVAELNKGAPIFSFLEGPPTANGYMHVGHARGRIYKDIYLRYMNMKGFYVWRMAGWDCQGLPTELEVEKKLNLSTKRDVETYGIEKFIEECNKLVDYYISHWVEASKKLALWLDYKNDYQTRRNEYMEHIWWFLKNAYENGLLIEDFKVVPICPHCETALSSHEVAQGYEEVYDPSIYVKFKIKGKEDEYIIIWTTTPWTLVANEAIAIHPNENYVIVSIGNEKWILAETLLNKVFEEIGIKEYKIIKKIKGDKIIGLEYIHPLIEEVKIHEEHIERAHRVYPAEYVSMEEGTGCVHTAPAHGPEDFTLGKKFNLPIFCPISQNGIFTSEGGKYSGLYFKDADNIIIEDLSKKGLLVKAGKILHTYPFCWRCGAPLIYLSSKQWFLKVDKIKNRMIEENRNIKWYPEWAGTNRFGDWLQNAEDWCISRTKYWGTPLNVWTCSKCGERKVIGRIKELEEAIKKPQRLELHRPWIDQFIFKCEKCNGEMYREPYVLDTWLDSGVAHFASINYINDKKLFDKLHPFDFITEAIDQTRGWFYTLLFTSIIAFNIAPFKTVLTQGHVLDKEGKKMSKSRGNVIWALDAFEKYGVDPLRVYLISKSQPWDSMNFVPEEISEIRENLNILFNIFSFAKTYFELDKFDPSKYSIQLYQYYMRIEDKWIISRINSLIKNVEASLESYQPHYAVRQLLDFTVNELSRIYIRAIRRRAWIEETTKDKIAAYTTLNYVLERLIRLWAPIIPYLSEFLYQSMKKAEDPESVHMLKWPKVDEKYIDQEIEDSMEIVQEVLSIALSCRQKAGRKLRWPVSHILISPNSIKVKKSLTIFKDYLKEQMNTNKLTILNIGEKPEGITIKAKPILSKLGPKLGKKAETLLETLKNIDNEKIFYEIINKNEAEIKLIDGSIVKINSEEIEFIEEIPDYMNVSEGKFSKIYLDKREDEYIKSISLANEVIRRIQIMRKELKMNVSDYIECVILAPSKEMSDLLIKASNYIKEETRAKEINILYEKIPLEKKDYLIKEWDIIGEKFEIYVRKSD